MADNVAITPGVGVSVATDDCGAGGHAQIVKLAISTDGSATAIPANAADGLLVNLGTNNDVTVTGVSTAAKQDTIIGHLDGVEGLLTTIDADTGTAAGLLATIDADTSALAGAVSGTEVQVDIVAALPAGTNAIGKLAANSGVDIGDVDVTSLTGGTIAHDAADSGNPIKVGGRAALTLSDDTMVANGDRADLVTDADSALIVRPGFPLGDLISERVTNTDGNSTALTNFGATASTRNYVTAIVVYNSSATAGTIDFRDGTAGSVLFTVPIPATGGCVIANGGMPLFKTSANTALAFDVSGALSTVTISLSGFKSKVV